MMTIDRILSIYNKLENRNGVYSLLNELQINIEYSEQREKSLLLNYNEYYKIILKANLKDEEFYILHEIGHFLLHKGYSINCININKIENEANLFACIYLINGDMSYLYYDQYLLSKGVPYDVVLKFEDSLNQYRQTKKFGYKWSILEC